MSTPPVGKAQAVAALQRSSIYLPLVYLPRALFLPLFSSATWGDGVNPDGLIALASRPRSAEMASRGFVTRQGEDLQVNGHPYVFVGINASYLVGPYFPADHLEEVISFMAANGIQVVRIWVEPGYNLDKVEYLFDLGGRYGVRFVVTLQDFFGHEDGWWFKAKYASIDLPWIQTVVPRFAGRSEVLMWELMNEPTCPGADANEACWKALYRWAQITSEEIKRLDAHHLISVGMQSAGFGARGIETFRRIHALDSIDVVTVHSEGGRVARGAREFERQVAHELGKPVFFGEVYVRGYDKSCRPISAQALGERAQILADDIRDSRQAGIDGYLLWQYAHCLGEPGGGPGRCFCGELDYYADDPVWAVLREGQ